MTSKKGTKKSQTRSYVKRAAVKHVRHPVPRNAIYTGPVKSSIKWGESYISLLLGVIVVILVSFGLVYFVKSKKVNQTGYVSSAKIQEQSEKQVSTTPTGEIENQVANKKITKATEELQNPKSEFYVVQRGDTLWDVAERMYGSGYKWTDIAKANNLNDPSLLFSGTKLTMPKVQTNILATSTDPSILAQNNPELIQSQTEKITADSYVIHRGDDLWDIAVRAYGDGFRWPDLAKANNLTNPDLIHAENPLKIPRP